MKLRELTEGFNNELYILCEDLDNVFGGELDIHMLNNKIQIRRQGDFRINLNYMKRDLIDRLIDENGEFRYGFGRVDANFIVEYPGLKSVKGLPNELGGDLDLGETFISSLHNLNKYVLKMNNPRGVIKLNWSMLKNSVLGILLIENCYRIENAILERHDKLTPFKIIRNIMSSSGFDDKTRRKFVIEAQNKLIDEGYEEYAQI